jgi:hypothetical protein
MDTEHVIAAPELELADVQRWHGSRAEIEHRNGPVFRRYWPKLVTVWYQKKSNSSDDFASSDTRPGPPKAPV